MQEWTEKFQVAGNRVVSKVRQLVKEGNVRKIIIRKPNGEILKELTLTAGVAIGGVAAFLLPWLAALGALLAMGMDYTIEVVRSEKSDDFEDEYNGTVEDSDDDFDGRKV